MKVSFAVMCDSAILLLLVVLTANMRGWRRQGFNIAHAHAVYIALSAIVLCMAATMLWLGYAMQLGHQNGMIRQRTRTTRYLKRNSLLYLFAGGVGLIAQTVVLLDALPLATIKQVLSLAIVAFGVLLLALWLFPTRDSR